MKQICVFCGSSPGTNPAYVRAAEELGTLLAQRNIGLVYGGSSLGLMGVVSRSAIRAGGIVTGVIPQAMVERGIESYGLSEVKIVGSMHERKAHMASLVDGFIALPGGYGTLEEIFEVIAWAQLGYHSKPCGLLNVEGYYDHLVAFLDQASSQQFIEPAHREMLLVDESPASLLDRFFLYKPPSLDKLLSAIQHTGDLDAHNGRQNVT